MTTPAFLMSLTDEFMKRAAVQDSRYGFSLLQHMSTAELEEVRTRVTRDCSAEVQVKWLSLIRALRYPHADGKPILTALPGGKP